MSEIKLETKREVASEVLTDGKNETKERILTKSYELFCRYGVKSMTMDEIARETGVSKKTVYQFFVDKDELVFEVSKHHFMTDVKEIDQMFLEAVNPIDEIMMLTKHMKKNLTNINPCLFFDLKKFYPKAFDSWKEHKNTFIMEHIKNNINKGIEQGFYRADINVEILAIMRLEQIELGCNPEIFSPAKFKLVDVQTTFINHFIRGIVTEKGYKMMEEYKNKMSDLF